MKNIAIVAGGYSGEAEISYKSAAAISRNIDTALYRVYIIKITKESWYYESSEGFRTEIDKNDFSLTRDNKKITFAGVFIAIHGTPGEDGKLQSYFDMLGIRYNTCDAITSSLTFNKNFCKQVVASLGIHTARSLTFYKGESVDISAVISYLGLPCFVKPNNGGSSIGMSKVMKKTELKKAIDKAFHEDDQVIIEEFVEGIELTCGMMKTGNKVIVFPVTQIVPVERPFFDYEAKYLNQSNEITPAPVSESIHIECKRISAFIYKRINCRGIVRFDYIYAKKKFHFLEVNTVPGQTDQSIVPQQARAMGISQKDLYAMVIEDMLK